MTVHNFTPQLKKYIAARLNDQNTPVVVTGMPIEDGDIPHILIATGYAVFRVPRPIYQMTFQNYFHREPPGPGEGFRMNGDEEIDFHQQCQQWEHAKNNCQTEAHLTPYLLDAFATKGKRNKYLRLLWADPHTIWIDADILNTVDARWGDLKAAAAATDPVYFRGENTEAILLPFRRCVQSERPGDNPLLIRETEMARVWYERRTTADRRE